MIRRFLAPVFAQPLFTTSVAAVLLLQALLIATHSYFVDEWQALQIAVQSPDWGSLLETLRYEGHPPLWYALIRGLAAVVGPGHALAAASALCAFTTIVVIATCAPLAKWQRLALMCSEPLLFEYGTIARSYALCVALAVVATALWERRRLIWLPLSLLPLVDFLGGLLALGLIALRLGEQGAKAQWRIGGAIFVTCSLAAAWTVLPAPDFVSVYNKVDAGQNIARWLRQMSTVTLPLQWNGGLTWDQPWQSPLTVPLGLLYFVLVADQTRGRLSERAVAVGAPVVLLLFMVAVHTLAIRHLMLAGIMFWLVMWRQAARGAPIHLLARIWLVAGAICGLVMTGFALTKPFDTAPVAAREIRARGLERETWVSFPPQHAQGVAALTGIGFEGLGHGCREDFVRWNYPHLITSPGKLRLALVRESEKGGRFYLLSGYALPSGSPGRTLARVSGGLNGKEYYLIEIPGQRSGRRALAKPCVPGLRPLPPLLP